MRFKSIAFPFGWAILIFSLCYLPGKDLPNIPVFGLDKLVHFSLFFILSLSIFRSSISFEKGTNFLIGFWIILQIIYGISLELYQGHFVADRTADPFDAVANSIGVVAGFYVYLTLKRRNL